MDIDLSGNDAQYLCEMRRLQRPRQGSSWFYWRPAFERLEALGLVYQATFVPDRKLVGAVCPFIPDDLWAGIETLKALHETDG